jgi:hypothetical protein
MRSGGSLFVDAKQNSLCSRRFAVWLAFLIVTPSQTAARIDTFLIAVLAVTAAAQSQLVSGCFIGSPRELTADIAGSLVLLAGAELL